MRILIRSIDEENSIVHQHLAIKNRYGLSTSIKTCHNIHIWDGDDCHIFAQTMFKNTIIADGHQCILLIWITRVSSINYSVFIADFFIQKIKIIFLIAYFKTHLIVWILIPLFVVNTGEESKFFSHFFYPEHFFLIDKD